MKLKSIVTFGILLILVLGCQTEQTLEDPSETHFIRFYGKDGDQTGRDLVVMPDGTMVLFGTTRPTPTNTGVDLKTQWFVTRVDEKGAILWEQEFGGPQDEEARDIELTSTGNLVLVGNTYKSTDDRDVMIMTLDPATGLMIKSATWFVNNAGADPFGDEDAATVTELVNGFVVAGSTTYVKTVNPADAHDALQLRVNSDLSIYAFTWSQSYGYPSDDYSVKIVPAPPSGNPLAGSYYAFGTTNKPIGDPVDNYNFWLVALGIDGVPLGIENYPGTQSEDDRVSSVCLSPAGYFMAGVAESAGAPQDIYITEAGVPSPPCTAPCPPPGFPVLKEKNLSINLGSGLRGATGVTASPIGGGYLVVSEENGFNANQNWMLTRLNSDKSLAWNQPIVFGGEGLDEIGAVQELPDGRIVIIGTMRTGKPDAGEFKMTLIKVSKNGKFEK